ncbi:hypothetical protein RJ639_038652 [Escallonia herrerae]|uniref:Uncharacterized protein n=1 Tax=Escallonia herrerae TaxID=1293975 RepID=A0AA88WN91_9ASTE|nr:hypothetical protein RJ639_038652 [Escallonia herrerae]
MVLSNKKLKEKLRAAALAESVAAAEAQSQPPIKISTKISTDPSETHKPRVSKREKRREKTVSFQKSNGGVNGSEGVDEEQKGKKNKKRKREGEGDGGEGDRTNGDSSNDLEANEAKKLKTEKNKKKKKTKGKKGEKKGVESGSGGSGEQSVAETIEATESQAKVEMSTKVYVGGIPYYSTEDDIRSFFEGCGTITEIDCMRFSETGKFRGIAIINFKTYLRDKPAIPHPSSLKRRVLHIRSIVLDVLLKQKLKNTEKSGLLPLARDIHVNPHQDTSYNFKRRFEEQLPVPAYCSCTNPLSRVFPDKEDEKKIEAAAKRALDLDGADMGGLFLKIQPYKTTRDTKASDFSPAVVEGYNRVYVGNLSWDITEDELRKLFSDCSISSIRFGEDKETKEFRGYVHVDFANSLSVAMALQLDQKVVFGRPVRIRCAVPKKVAESNARSMHAIPKKVAETNSNSMPAAPKKVAETNSNSMPAAPKKVAETNSKVMPAVPKKAADTISKSPSATTNNIADTNSQSMLTNKEANGAELSAVSGKIRRRTCYECGERGHLSSSCPKKAADPTSTTAV